MTATDMTQTGGGGPGGGTGALSPAERNLDPYLHIDPSYINVATCAKVFGPYFKEFYLSRTIKENTDYAKVFNDHLLVTFAMDACRSRAVASLGEVLGDPLPGQLFCSTEALEGTAGVSGEARTRNRVVLPYGCGREVFVELDPHHFLSAAERGEQAGHTRTSLICHVDVVKPDLVSATALIMGAPTFTHFRNDGAALDLAEAAADWFETLPGDIDQLKAMAGVAPPDEAVWPGALAALPGEAVADALCAIMDGAPIAPGPGQRWRMIACGASRGGTEAPCALALMDPKAAALEPDMLWDAPGVLAALAATPAELWIVQHGQGIGPAVREMVRAFAVRPHAPRRYCLIDGADTWRILTAYGKL